VRDDVLTGLSTTGVHGLHSVSVRQSQLLKVNCDWPVSHRGRRCRGMPFINHSQQRVSQYNSMQTEMNLFGNQPHIGPSTCFASKPIAITIFATTTIYVAETQYL